MIRYGSIVVAAVLMAVVVAVAAERPKPPAGYTWQEVPEVKAAFLKPDGWFFGKAAKGDEFTAYVTQEDVEKEGRFRTGLVMSVFVKSHPDNAIDYAAAFISRLADPEKAEVFTRKLGPLEMFACRIHRTAAGEAVMTHNLMVANPNTGTIYLFIFKAPQASWDTAWSKGEQIMNMLGIDDGL